MFRTSIAAAGLSALLAGCCSPVKTETSVVKVETVRRIPVPVALTAPCLHDAHPETVGELYAAYEEARATIAECDSRLAEIRGLK